MTNIYDENGSIHVPVGATDEWINALDAEGIPKNLQKALIEKAMLRAERAEAEQKMADAVNARENRQAAALRALTETEINQCALLSVDHIKGTLLVAQKLQAVIDKHTEPPNPLQKRGNINTVLDYIIAHITLLEGVRISKKPLHDLRTIHTPEHADACGISHKNLSLIWKCLLSIQKSGDSIPFGNETQLFDRARTMTKHAEQDKKDQDAAKQTLDAISHRKKRIDDHVKARHTFFPDLAVYSDHEFLGEIFKRKAENEEKGVEMTVREPLGIEGGKRGAAGKKKPRTADRGSGHSEMYKKNMALIEKSNRGQ